MRSVANPLDRDNPDTEPDALFIHSAAVVQRADWCDWCRAVVVDLTRIGWVQRRVGSAVHLFHPVLIGGHA